MTNGLMWDQTSHNNPQTLDHLNMGMLIEAGVEYYRATGDARLLRAGIRFLNNAVDYSNHGEKNFISFHGGVEYPIVMLCEFLSANEEVKSNEYLSDLTINEQDYLEYVYYELANHGSYENRAMGHFYNTYDNDHITYDKISIAAGHAVSANLYYTGLAEYGRAAKDVSFLESATRLWNDIVNKQMYVTGGTGSIHSYEGYGGDYHLPNDGYCESCASGALAQLSASLGLSLADGQYQDIVELQIYNNLLGSIGANGNTFFYQNPMNTSSTARWSWHPVACCTKYGLMIYGNLPKYIYSYAGNDVFVNQYIGSSANLPLRSGNVSLTQQGDWAYGGRSKITVSNGAENLGALKLRVPEWSANTVIFVNGIKADHQIVNNYAVIDRSWANGDCVEIIADMSVQRVYSDERVVTNQGLVALKRGPLVYCLEEVDNTVEYYGNVAPYAILDKDAVFEEFVIDDLYGGVVAVSANAEFKEINGDTHEFTLIAVPFYARSNRKAGSVTTYIAEDINFAGSIRQVLEKSLNWASSTTDNGASSHAALDNNSETRWCANGPSFPQTLLVDLTGQRSISQVNTNFEQPGNWKYVIYYSLDGETWNVFVDKSDNEIKLQTYQDVNEVTARYVAIEILDGGLDANGSRCWASIWEFAVLEKDTGLNLALNMPSAATSTSWVGAQVDAIFDNNSNTRWCASDSSLPQTVAFDIGGVTLIESIEIDFEQVSNWNCKIEVSQDGITWTDYATLNQRGKTFTINGNLSGRYIRIVVNGTSGGAWASIVGIQVHTAQLFKSMIDKIGEQ